MANQSEITGILEFIKGEKGEDGVDGATPVRGVDYWTEEDKQEIISEIPSGSFDLSDRIAKGTDSGASGGVVIGQINGQFAARATGEFSLASGEETLSSGTYSHAEGLGSKASATAAHAEGYNTIASGNHSHAEGNYTVASGNYSHAEGISDVITLPFSGVKGTTTYTCSYIEFYYTAFQIGRSFLYGGNIYEVTAYNGVNKSVTFDKTLNPNEAWTSKSINLIALSVAEGKSSHTEGGSNAALGISSHAEGYLNNSTGSCSHSEGSYNIASGQNAHAEGAWNTASGSEAHVEGRTTIASGDRSHTEGEGSEASGDYSHAEGHYSTASGECSHAEGASTIASGDQSHAEGTGTIANHDSQHVFGEYNIPDDSSESSFERGNYIEIVGNGSSSQERSNARTLDWGGNEALAGGLTLGMGTADEVTVSAAQLKALLALLQ